MSAAVRTSGEPASRGVFCVPSASTPGAVWDVLYVSPGRSYCGCPSFAHRQQCRHVEQVALAVEIEARDLAAGRLTAIEEMFR